MHRAIQGSGGKEPDPQGDQPLQSIGMESRLTRGDAQPPKLMSVKESLDPLVMVTISPAQTLADAKGIARIYLQRWSIKTGFETMHGWGQDRFVVRSFDAIDGCCGRHPHRRLLPGLTMLRRRPSKKSGMWDNISPAENYQPDGLLITPWRLITGSGNWLVLKTPARIGL